MKSSFQAFLTCFSAVILIGLIGWPIGYLCGWPPTISFFDKIVANSPDLCILSLGIFFGVLLLSGGAFLLPIKTGRQVSAFVFFSSILYDAMSAGGMFAAQHRPFLTPKFYLSEAVIITVGLFLATMLFSAFLFQKWKNVKAQTD